MVQWVPKEAHRVETVAVAEAILERTLLSLSPLSPLPLSSRVPIHLLLQRPILFIYFLLLYYTHFLPFFLG